MKELEKTERKQRNHDKTGKLAKKREQRRLDAIERQVRRIQTLEENLKTAKKKGEAVLASPLLCTIPFRLTLIREKPILIGYHIRFPFSQE